jgi:enterochelin esterase-like enzyme
MALAIAAGPILPTGKLAVERVLIQDLIPHIDSTYRTLATRKDRALEGFSMGGFGAVHLAFKYPELFGAVAMDSAALFDDSKDEGVLEQNSPCHLAVRNAGAIRGQTMVRMAVGDKDTLLGLQRQFGLLLDALQIEHEAIALPSVGHNKDGVYTMLGTRVASFYATAFGTGKPTAGKSIH